RGCGRSTRKDAAASRSAIASKSDAPRPSDGNSTIGCPCPWVSISIWASPRVTMVRVTIGEKSLMGLGAHGACWACDRSRCSAARRCRRSNARCRCRRNPGRGSAAQQRGHQLKCGRRRARTPHGRNIDRSRTACGILPKPAEPILARKKTQETETSKSRGGPACAGPPCPCGEASEEELDLRPVDTLGGHQLADPLAGIEHAGLHCIGRHRDDLRNLLHRLLVIVDEVDDL